MTAMNDDGPRVSAERGRRRLYLGSGAGGRPLRSAANRGRGVRGQAIYRRIIICDFNTA